MMYFKVPYNWNNQPIVYLTHLHSNSNHTVYMKHPSQCSIYVRRQTFNEGLESLQTNIYSPLTHSLQFRISK